MSNRTEWDVGRVVHAAWRVGLVGVALYTLVMALRYSSQVLLLFGVGALNAIFLNGLARTLETRCEISYRTGLGIVVFALLVLGGFLAKVLGGEVARQSFQLVENLPTSVRDLREMLIKTDLGQKVWALVNGPLQNGEGPSLVQGFLTDLLGWFSTSLGAVLSLLLLFFVTVYLASEPSTYRKGFIRLFRPDQRERADRVLGAVENRLRHWLYAQFSSMALLTVLTSFALWMLELPMFLALGVLTGLIAFIPYVGPILSVVPAALVASSEGVQTVAWVFAVYAMIQLLESYIISPLFHREMANLPPVITLFFQSSLGIFFGLLGLLLAAPITAVVLELVKQLWVKPLERGEY